MVLIIVSLLSLLCMLQIFLGSSNHLLHPSKKLIMGLILNPCANYNINGVIQLLSKNKLI